MNTSLDSESRARISRMRQALNREVEWLRQRVLSLAPGEDPETRARHGAMVQLRDAYNEEVRRRCA